MSFTLISLSIAQLTMVAVNNNELFSNLKMWKINNVGRQGKGNISVDHK